MVVRRADEYYSLGIDTVHERHLAAGNPSAASARVRGSIVNLPGKVIPIIDLRKRFASRQAEAERSTQVVVVELSDLVVGLTVDEV